MTKSNGAIIVFLILGALIRCILFYYPNIHTILSSRPELTTPTSSFRRLSESIFLFEHGHSPYEGDIFHQPPLVFALFYPLFQTPKEYFYIQSCGIFILVDLLIALGLARLCRNIHLQEEGIVPMEKNEEIWLNKIPLSPLFSPKNHAVTVVAM
jgi:phosphatidylinositol glycan class U